MEICTRIYRPRKPKESPLFRLVSQHIEAFLRVYPERFANEHGPRAPLDGPPEAGRLEGWTPDGRSLVVVETLFPGARILKRDLATGERTVIRELRPEDPTGITLFRGTVAPSGDTFAAFYVRGSTALFLARGLR